VANFSVRYLTALEFSWTKIFVWPNHTRISLYLTALEFSWTKILVWPKQELRPPKRENVLEPPQWAEQIVPRRQTPPSSLFRRKLTPKLQKSTFPGKNFCLLQEAALLDGKFAGEKCMKWLAAQNGRRVMLGGMIPICMSTRLWYSYLTPESGRALSAASLRGKRISPMRKLQPVPVHTTLSGAGPCLGIQAAALALLLIIWGYLEICPYTMVVHMEVPQTLCLRALISSVLVGGGGSLGKNHR